MKKSNQTLRRGKLVLRSETIALLTSSQLGRAGGGGVVETMETLDSWLGRCGGISDPTNPGAACVVDAAM